MRGLLMKDFKLMVGEKGAFWYAVFIAGILLIFGMAESRAPADGFSYECVLIPIMAVGTKSYDVYENGMPCLLTLPVSRRGYVRESYLFAILVSVVLTFISSVLKAITTVLMGGNLELYMVLADEMGKPLGIILLLIALTIPIEIRFGGKKRIGIVVIVTVIIAVGVFLGLILALDDGLLIAVMIQKWMKVLAGFPAVLAILAFSYVLSVIIIEKKEF